jgi:ABC-type nickel/cobalt efflux system permease component RcnA
MVTATDQFIGTESLLLFVSPKPVTSIWYRQWERVRSTAYLYWADMYWWREDEHSHHHHHHHHHRHHTACSVLNLVPCSGPTNTPEPFPAVTVGFVSHTVDIS